MATFKDIPLQQGLKYFVIAPNEDGAEPFKDIPLQQGLKWLQCGINTEWL